MPVVAIDFGTRRVGVAVSTSGILATPHAVIPNEGDVERVIERIVAIGEEIEAELYVVGLPRRTRSGSADPALAPYRDLAERLRQRTRKEVVLWDEAYSTAEASSRARERGRRPTSIDMEAAAVILQAYLDERGGTR
ncbi:MAG: Holliday junction resolvase RuvX [Thermoanaerobaculia bacterium]